MITQHAERKRVSNVWLTCDNTSQFLHWFIVSTEQLVSFCFIVWPTLLITALSSSRITFWHQTWISTWVSLDIFPFHADKNLEWYFLYSTWVYLTILHKCHNHQPLIGSPIPKQRVSVCLLHYLFTRLTHQISFSHWRPDANQIGGKFLLVTWSDHSSISSNLLLALMPKCISNRP